jgi:hypothetical protein
MSKPEDFKFDNRIRDRLIRNQTLTSAEVKRHLEQLPDLDGEYEVMNDTPQPAVAPARSEIHEEPLVFDGIRRLQALADVSLPPARYAQPAASPSSSGLPPYREPESRTLGTPLRSALMESEISGVGAGAVSAALGAMAAEARSASVFGVSGAIPFASAPEPEQVPVTLRSEASPKPAEPVSAEADDDDDDDDVSGDDDDDDEVDDDEEAEFGGAESSDAESSDAESSDAESSDAEPEEPA